MKEQPSGWAIVLIGCVALALILYSLVNDAPMEECLLHHSLQFCEE